MKRTNETAWSILPKIFVSSISLKIFSIALLGSVRFASQIRQLYIPKRGGCKLSVSATHVVSKHDKLSKQSHLE